MLDPVLQTACTHEEGDTLHVQSKCKNTLFLNEDSKQSGLDAGLSRHACALTLHCSQGVAYTRVITLTSVFLDESIVLPRMSNQSRLKKQSYMKFIRLQQKWVPANNSLQRSCLYLSSTPASVLVRACNKDDLPALVYPTTANTGFPERRRPALCTSLVLWT